MGVRLTQSILYRGALADVGRARARLARTQEQATSGLRVNRPSDDPVAARASMLLRGGIDATEQYQRNVTLTRERVRAVDRALEDGNDTLVRARELAMSGANGTLDAASRRSLAGEIATLHARLLSNGNTRSSGGYVFAGHLGDAEAFSSSGPFASGTPAPVVSFVGDPSELEVDIDEGLRAQASFDGRRVFLGDADGDASPDAGREDLFDVLSDLWTALDANDPAAAAATLGRIDRGLEQIGAERTRVGGVETRLEQAADKLEQRRISLIQQLSDAQDADSAEVFSRLVTQEAALTASLDATARLLTPTLLDYLG